MNLQTKFLSFEIDENGGNAGFIIRGKEDSAARGSDYFRLILDDGLRTEIPILSHKQTGKAVMDGDNATFGAPTVEGASVEATVVKNGKGKKIRIFKYTPKKGYRKRQGHRQPYTKVQIGAIKA